MHITQIHQRGSCQMGRIISSGRHRYSLLEAPREGDNYSEVGVRQI